MRKKVFGRQFKRDINERKALFKGLMSSLVLEERIKTTEEKARSIRSEVEKLVTKAKRSGDNAKHMVQAQLYPHAVDKLITDIAPRFADRPGGYTRIVRIGNRLNDNATMVFMEWVEKPSREAGSGSARQKVEAKGKKKTKKTNQKKNEVVEAEVVTAKAKKDTKAAKKAKTVKPAKAKSEKTSKKK